MHVQSCCCTHNTPCLPPKNLHWKKMPSKHALHTSVKVYGVTTALLSTSGLRLVSFPPSYRTKLGSCLETAELSTLCLKSKSKRGITNQKTGIFGISRKNLCFYASRGEEGCSNLKTIVSDSRMSMSLLRKFGNHILR